jgi:hypothetical protein
MLPYDGAMPESFILIKQNQTLPKACLTDDTIWIVKPGENTN